jgi:hypothetical protein
MGVRLLDEAQHSTIMPVRHQPQPTITGPVVAAAPEPAQLYNLTVLTFLLHTPELHGWCVSCGQGWPCPQVCLAYRIREGF